MKKIIFSNPIKHKLRISSVDIKKNIAFIVFGIIFFIGIIFGSVSGNKANEELLKRLDFIFLTNFDLRCTQGLLATFISSFATGFIFLLIIFLLGLSVWGGLLVLVIPFFKGYGYGLSVGYLYSAYSFYGVLYNVLIILPGAFVCSLVIVASSQESFRNSFVFMSYFRRSSINHNPYTQMKKYIISMLWFFIIMLVSAIIDVVFSLCFSWIFNF